MLNFVSIKLTSTLPNYVILILIDSISIVTGFKIWYNVCFDSLVEKVFIVSL